MNKIINKIVYGNVPKEFYNDNKKILDETNYHSVRYAYEVATVIYAALALLATFYPVVANTLYFYLAMAVINCFLMLIVILWLPGHRKWMRWFYHLFEMIAFLATIAAGTYFSPNDLAVLFFVLLVILPLLYIEKPIDSILVSLSAYVIFCLITYQVKEGTSYLVYIDILNATCCEIIGCIFIYFVRNMHLKNIRAVKMLQIQSRIDGLTGVLNKVNMENLCQRYLDEQSMIENSVLMVLDIDEFKKINDTLGHTQGDLLLKQIGIILKSIFNEEDIIGRVGGDEFMVLMKNLQDIKIAGDKANKVIEEISLIFSDYSNRQYGCSIGVVSNEKQGMSFEEMYSKADQALYLAKHQGRGCYIIYQEGTLFIDENLPKMLIVDASETSRVMLRTALNTEYNIIEADNGENALIILNRFKEQIKVVLLDLEIPVMSGYDVFKYIKQDNQLKKIPVLIIADNNKSELLALELGVDNLITKPYDPLIVKMRVANALKEA